MFFIVVGLCEAMYFINLAFMILFVFVPLKYAWLADVGCQRHDQQQLLIPNFTFVLELVAFLLVLGFLAKYVLPPLRKVMNERAEPTSATRFRRPKTPSARPTSWRPSAA